MPTLITSAQIERFKREAKKLSRSSGVCHGHALDQIAEEQGYKNWSLFIKHNSSDLAAPFCFIRSFEEMHLAILKGPQPREWGVTRYGLAEERTEDICSKFVSATNATSFAVDYMNCLLSLPRYRLTPGTLAWVEMHCWLPYSVLLMEDGKQILVNRNYKPVGTKSKEWVEYEDYAHLHSRLNDAQMKSFSPRIKSPGFIFNDGCAPWHSRKDAEAYLARLKLLLLAIQASSSG